MARPKTLSREERARRRIEQGRKASYCCPACRSTFWFKAGLIPKVCAFCTAAVEMPAPITAEVLVAVEPPKVISAVPPKRLNQEYANTNHLNVVDEIQHETLRGDGSIQIDLNFS